MLIMIILIVLSILFLIGTIIYSNYKKKNYNNKLEKQGLSKKNKKSNKNISDILDIQIKDCFIKVGNRYSSILRLGNIDYHMLSDDEQEVIENVLVQTALSIDYNIQFYNTTETIDTSKIINMMQDNKLDSYKANEYKEYMISYLQNLMENRNITVVRNYAIISYDGLFEDAQTELIRLCNSFKNNLLRAKIQAEILEEIDLYNLLFRELNKNSKVKLDSLNTGGENLYVGKAKKNKKAKK
ncbi:MAG: hypothetical protein ACI4UX_03705 [Clostridia bacterium]